MAKRSLFVLQQLSNNVTLADNSATADYSKYSDIIKYRSQQSFSLSDVYMKSINLFLYVLENIKYIDLFLSFWTSIGKPAQCSLCLYLNCFQRQQLRYYLARVFHSRRNALRLW